MDESQPSVGGEAPEAWTPGVAATPGALSQIFSYEEMIRKRVESTEELMQKIGIPKGTLDGLLKVGSDWEFIIQLAVILESAVTEALVSYLHDERLRDHVQRLNMGGRTGKILFARQVELLDEQVCATLTQITEIRNAFAHSPRNIGGSLATYAAQMNDIKSVGQRLLGTTKAEADSLFSKGTAWFSTGLRYYAWIGATQVLAALALQDTLAETKRKLQGLQEQLLADAQAGSLGMAGLWRSQKPGKIGAWW